jgi:hypothetical protein
MRSIKLYATGSATANNVANVTIPTSTRIVGVQVCAALNSAVDDSSATLEISQASSTEIAVNGAQQCIVEVRLYQNFATSGLSFSGVNTFLPVDVAVKQGQIIYFHAVVSSATYYFSGLLWIRD